MRALHKKVNFQRAAFTLVEVLLYSGVLAIVLSGFTLVLFGILSSAGKLDSGQTLFENKLFVTQKIDWLLRDLSAVNSPATGSYGEILSVNKLNFSDNPLVFDVLSGTARLKRGAQAAENLTTPGVQIKNFRVDHIASTTHERLRFTGSLVNEAGTTSLDYSVSIK